MLFFKSDAKVRNIFETTKFFGNFFQTFFLHLWNWLILRVLGACRRLWCVRTT